MTNPVLEKIVGFDTTYNRASEVHHYGSHFGKDLSGVPTPDDYLALARRLAASAARGDPGTFVKERGNGDIAIYVDNHLCWPHSHIDGIYLVIRSRQNYGVLATMFAPDDGKAYFDRDDRMLI